MNLDNIISPVIKHSDTQIRTNNIITMLEPTFAPSRMYSDLHYSIKIMLDPLMRLFCQQYFLYFTPYSIDCCTFFIIHYLKVQYLGYNSFIMIIQHTTLYFRYNLGSNGLLGKLMLYVNKYNCINKVNLKKTTILYEKFKTFYFILFTFDVSPFFPFIIFFIEIQ